MGRTGRLAAAGLCTVLVLAGAALASDNPVVDAATAPVEDTALEYLGDVLAPEAVVAYKAADFAREMGAAGVEAESKTLDAEMIAVAQDLEVLKTLHAHNIDLNSDPIALAAKYHLKAEQERMSADGLSDTDFILRSVARHQGYALGRASFGVLLEKAVTRGLDGAWKGLKIRGPRGEAYDKVIAKLMEDKAWELGDRGWTALAERGRDAEPYVTRYRHAAGVGKPPREAAHDAVDLVLNEEQARAFQAAFDAALAKSPPGDAGVRRAMVIAALPQLIPAPAVQAPAPAQAMPAPPAPAEAAPAPVPPTGGRFNGNLYVDPVGLSIRLENRGGRDSSGGSRPSTPPTAPPPSSGSSPPWEMSPGLKDELRCVGSHAAGCEKYMSSSGGATDGGNSGTYLGTRATRNQ